MEDIKIGINPNYAEEEAKAFDEDAFWLWMDWYDLDEEEKEFWENFDKHFEEDFNLEEQYADCRAKEE